MTAVEALARRLARANRLDPDMPCRPQPQALATIAPGAPHAGPYVAAWQNFALAAEHYLAHPLTRPDE